MKFYGSGVVWDAENNKALVEFGAECEAEITDERVVKLLKDAGYECEPEKPATKKK